LLAHESISSLPLPGRRVSSNRSSKVSGCSRLFFKSFDSFITPPRYLTERLILNIDDFLFKETLLFVMNVFPALVRGYSAAFGNLLHEAVVSHYRSSGVVLVTFLLVSSLPQIILELRAPPCYEIAKDCHRPLKAKTSDQRCEHIEQGVLV